MTGGFPLEAVPLLRCPDDGAGLEVDAPATAARCPVCGRAYPIEGPVLRLGWGGLHPESDHERRIRDDEAVGRPPRPLDTPADIMEIGAMLAALDLQPHHRLLELGAGTGRFTRLVEQKCRLVVGIDISLESLRVGVRLLASGKVALVQADATSRVVAPRSFDRALGTLTSNLPSRRDRERSYEAAAHALADDGKLVFSTHYYGLRARLDREPKEGRYTEHGIYRCLLTPSEAMGEARPYFRKVRVRPICVVLPFSRRLGLPTVSIDRLARRVPVLRAFGHLLLVEASRPRR